MIKVGDKYRFNSVNKRAVWLADEIYEVTYIWDGDMKGAIRITSARMNHDPVVFDIEDDPNWTKV